jgi:hypothetical protein
MAEIQAGSEIPDIDTVSEDCEIDCQDWLLYVMICGGKGLYIGPDCAEGDIFCMIHTQIHGEPRSRTVTSQFFYLTMLC